MSALGHHNAQQAEQAVPPPDIPHASNASRWQRPKRQVASVEAKRCYRSRQTLGETSCEVLDKRTSRPTARDVSYQI